MVAVLSERLCQGIFNRRIMVQFYEQKKGSGDEGRGGHYTTEVVSE